MTSKRIIAIIVIFTAATGAWGFLGTITSGRSHSYFFRLEKDVESLWGIPLIQKTPTFTVQIPGTKRIRRIMPVQNDVNVQLDSDYRKKGLLWYSTYNCDFESIHTITNTDGVTQKVRLHFNFPAQNATYDDFAMFINNQPSTAPINTVHGISELIELPPGKEAVFKIRYKTRGINQWRYQLDKNLGRVRNLNVTVQTDFKDVDFTTDSLSPMVKKELEKGMALTWKAGDLITGNDIGVIIPDKINPGPLTTRITFFAPVCLIFFFVLITAISIMFRINIHPMHYLFVAAGFFAFHLLLSYFAGHINIHLAFIISSVASVGLVTFYLSAALGKSFPWKTALAGQLFFLVLFSYTFFIKGITGLTVAIGSVVTLGVLMKITAGVDWDEVFKKNTTQKKDRVSGPGAEPPPVPAAG